MLASLQSVTSIGHELQSRLPITSKHIALGAANPGSPMKQMSPPDLAPDKASAAVSRNDYAAEVARVRSAYSRRKDHSPYSMFDPAQMLAVQERERKLLFLLAQHGRGSLATTKVLEIGCGNGFWLREFVKWGARPENLSGVDLLPERIAEAKRLCPSRMTLNCQNATELQASDGTFDIVLQSTVFTSILDSKMKQQIAGHMLRLLNANGLIVWYDFCFNNPANPDVRAVRKKEILELFPGCRIYLEKVTLAPPLARRLVRISLCLYRTLSIVKPLCTHYLGIITKS